MAKKQSQTITLNKMSSICNNCLNYMMNNEQRLQSGKRLKNSEILQLLNHLNNEEIRENIVSLLKILNK